MEAFLLALRQHLNGKISPYEVDEAINYYRDYITNELNNGRSMEDILKELGDPNFLARSFVTASKAKRGIKPESQSYTYTENYVDDGDDKAHTSKGSYNESTYTSYNDPFSEDNDDKKGFKGFLLNARKYLKFILVLLVIIAILGIVFKIAMYLLIPILVIALIVFILNRI